MDRVESTSVAVAQVPVYFAEYPVVSPVTQNVEDVQAIV